MKEFIIIIICIFIGYLLLNNLYWFLSISERLAEKIKLMSSKYRELHPRKLDAAKQAIIYREREKERQMRIAIEKIQEAERQRQIEEEVKIAEQEKEPR